MQSESTISPILSMVLFTKLLTLIHRQPSTYEILSMVLFTKLLTYQKKTHIHY